MEPVAITTELNVGQKSHEGMSGKANEDSLGVFAWKYDKRHKLILGVVADGVGGQIAGEVASRLAVETIQNYFNAIDRIDNINNHLEEAIVAANKAVYQSSRDNPEYQGMSTTVAMTAIIDDHLFTAHVGDSRIYLYRDGRLRQISIDHTWAQEAIEAGLLTPEQAKKHPNRNVIRRHLGGSMEVEVDHRLALEAGQSPVAARANQGMIIREGDTLLICSDGLTDMINDQALLESLYNHYFELQTATDELVDKANQAGGKDNITVVILQVPPKGPPPAAVVAAPAIAAAAAPVATPVAAPVATPTAAAPVSAQPAEAPPPAKTGGSGSKAALLLIGGAVLIFILVVVIGGILFIGGSGDGDDTPEGATTVPVVVPEGATVEPGAPATAAFLTTESGGVGTDDGSSPINTPGLIPTLRATISPSATRPRVIVQPTETPSATATGAGSLGGGPPQPTDRPPANTPQATNSPAPSNTPRPPTNTPQPPPTNTTAPPTDEPTVEVTIAEPTLTKSASELD